MINKQLLSYKHLYEVLGFTVMLGYCYIKKDGKKSFVPQGKIPEWKLNAVQILPDSIAVIVDIDIRDGIDGSRNLPCNIPEFTPKDRSQSGSFRYWFRYDFRLNTITGDSSKIDLLTGNSAVIAAPSNVENGGVYSWIIPLKRIDDLQPMPKELFDFFNEKILVREAKKTVQIPVKNIVVKNLQDITERQKNSLIATLNRVTGNNSLFRFLTFAFDLGLDSNTIRNLCRDNQYLKNRPKQYLESSIRRAADKIGAQYV